MVIQICGGRCTRLRRKRIWPQKFIKQLHLVPMSQISLDTIIKRVEKKKTDYQKYNFERLQEEAFATFFDLAQEYTSLEALYLISVAVPKIFFDLESKLYLVGDDNKMRLVCNSETGIVADQQYAAEHIKVTDSYYSIDHSLVFPIRGNRALRKRVPFHVPNQVLGAFEIFSSTGLSERWIFFFEKFTNRIGYNLHQKMLIQQNIEHIKFINRLVADIEHNVISPNLYYKLFFRRLDKIISNFAELRVRLSDIEKSVQQVNVSSSEALRDFEKDFGQNLEELERNTEEVKKHYEHISLFLETLFRRDHFLRGTYVLRTQSCNFKREILEPLLSRYLPRFRERGIVVENLLEDVPDDEIELVVDKGLISQVFDNYFSNAVKYTREIVDYLGHKVKFVSCGRQVLKDYFGENIDGIKFTVFTTGEPLSEEEASKVYQEGYRSSEMGLELGAGHGLSFVKHVIEIHGGEVGCLPQKNGNLFYFIIPRKR